jgi:hypothetical protein
LGQKYLIFHKIDIQEYPMDMTITQKICKGVAAHKGVTFEKLGDFREEYYKPVHRIMMLDINDDE